VPCLGRSLGIISFHFLCITNVALNYQFQIRLLLALVHLKKGVFLELWLVKAITHLQKQGETSYYDPKLMHCVSK
jgi:hypothetical protein